MNEAKKGKRDQRQGDDDWRARFDGIENAGDQQVEALRRLVLESKTAGSGVRDGRLIALQGHFPSETPDPMKAVAAFLATHAVALGFDVPGRVSRTLGGRLLEVKAIRGTTPIQPCATFCATRLRENISSLPAFTIRGL